MTTMRHVRAVGVTSDSSPQWRVEVETGTHHLVADEPTNMAGGDAGPTPFGLLLCSLAACTAMTLRQYADRKGWQLTTIDVSAVYNVADDERTSISRTTTVPSDLTQDQRTRLADIADRTPVTMAIRAGTPIATTIRADETPTEQPSSQRADRVLMTGARIVK
jgi:putative redox protein